LAVQAAYNVFAEAAENHLKITAAKAIWEKFCRSNNLQYLFDSINFGIKNKLQ